MERRIKKSLTKHVDTLYGVTNEAIHELCSLLNPLHYKGTFPSNQITFKFSPPSSYIVNIGGHFIALICKPHFCLYIDPFGLPCRDKDLQQRLKTLSVPVFYNSTPIQSLTSMYCGMYAILFVVYFDKSRDRNKRLRFHRRNLKANDKVCLKYISSLLAYLSLFVKRVAGPAKVALAPPLRFLDEPTSIRHRMNGAE